MNYLLLMNGRYLNDYENFTAAIIYTTITICYIYGNVQI